MMLRGVRPAVITIILSCSGVTVAADFDGDFDVDQADFGRLQTCFSGDGLPYGGGCDSTDLDGDGDVDGSDVTLFQACMGGPGLPAAEACVPPPPADITLVPPPDAGPILAAITGYEMDRSCPYSDPAMCELPLLRPYNRDTGIWWDNLVEELIHSRVQVVMMHGRGCFDPHFGDEGNGNMCPRLLSRLVEAIDRSPGARDVLRLGMWDDTGAYQGTRNHVEGLGGGTLFDLSNPTTWAYFWDHNMRIWFDTVPPCLWYRLDGKPVVAFWGPVGMSNLQGNASRLFVYLRANFLARYGEDPHFSVTSDWLQRDTTLTTQHVQAAEGWFDPTHNTYTYFSWNGARWGCAVPGFRDGPHLPGCGDDCRERVRDDGHALRNGLAAGAAMGARLTLLEGWTDVAESAGYYRSPAWRYPNQYINIVREFADPQTRTLRFQAESADTCFDTTLGNSGGAYRDGDMDIAPFPGGGWYVDATRPGEWLAFQEVALACGAYRFTARVSGDAGRRLHLEVDGHSLGSVPLRPAAPGTWQLLRLGAVALAAGRHDLKLVFDSGDTGVDWIFSRKSASAGDGCRCIHLRAGNGQYVVASNGGGGTVRADGQEPGAWQTFTLIDQNGAALESGDAVGLLTWNGRNYLQAQNGGGGTVMATPTQMGAWERFKILRIAGAGAIQGGDSVALQAANGQYVVAEESGGGAVNANRTAIGPWEVFRLEWCE